MEEAHRLKKTLKQWESAFLMVHERKPGKADIDAAPEHIRETYRDYTQIKKNLSCKETVDHNEAAKKTENLVEKNEDNNCESENKMEDKIKTSQNQTDDADKDKIIDENDEGHDCDDMEKEKGPAIDVWDVKFDRKNSASVDQGKDVKGIGKSADQPAFLKNLGKRMYEQSRKLEKLNTGLKPGLKPWRKPDTPRRGLGPLEHPLKGRPPPPISSLVEESDVADTVEEDIAESINISSFDEVDSFQIKPAKFGKLFEKAATMTKFKPKTVDDSDNDDIYLNKFQTKFKKKQSLLPGKLSALVSKHRETMNFEDEMVENQEINDEMMGSAQHVDDANDTNDADAGPSHSWNVSVSKLIKDDELEQKRQIAKEKKLANKIEKEKRISELGDKEKNKKVTQKRNATSVKTERKIGKLEADSGVSGVKEECENQLNQGQSKRKPIETSERTDTVNDQFAFDASEGDVCEENISLNEIKAAGKRAARKTTARTGKRKPVIDDEDDDDVEDMEGIRKGNVRDVIDEEEWKMEVEEPEKKVVAKRGVRNRAGGGGSRGRKRKTVEDEDDVDDTGISESVDDGNNVNVEGESEAGTVTKKKVTAKFTKTEPAAKKRKTNTGAGIMVDGDGEGGGSKMTFKKPVARKKAVSGGENFIKLNMKIKTYKRKGRQMTGPQYKRKMWKEKMAARSKSYGDACFKCGQSGHWANKCPGGGQSANKYEKEPVLDEDFPSMQEAAMMARGCSTSSAAAPKPKPKAHSEDSSVAMETISASEPVMDADDDVDLEIQSSIVRSRREISITPPSMEPLIACEEEETIPSTPEFVLQGLRKFGFEKFRPGQEEAVMRILCGLSTLVVLSTGGGKSLCYQLPAYLYAERSSCITLVISPLVSLMEDQVTGLPNGIRGVCLHTNMTPNQRESVLASVKSGKAHFLLVSPEAIAGGSMSLISSMSSLPPVAFVCIDEAHCLSEWSHNFRPSYLRLCKVLQDKLGIQCFLGLTATATLSTACDVSRHLKISDFQRATVRGSPIPNNLILSASRDENRDEALTGLLKGERFGNLDSIIIYCTRRDQTDKVATIIRTCMNTGAPLEKLTDKGRRQRPKLEWSAESYHAGLTAAQRKRVQNAFMTGKLRVVAATVAFGMGLDKSDVRGVIHYNMPKSFESYVQEIGRAGRDGQRAECHVFLDPEGRDLCELRRHTYANTIDYRTLKRLVQKVFPPCRCRDVHEKHAEALREAEEISKVFEEEMEEDDFDTPSSNSKTEPLDSAHKEKNQSKTEESVKDSNNETEQNVDTTTVVEDGVDANKCKSLSDKREDETADVSDKFNRDTGEVEEGTNRMDTEIDHRDMGPDWDSGNKDAEKTAAVKGRLCPGHERALPIQQTVMELDVKEEGISTLLCYLELHDSQWLENMSSVYATCKVQCYAGPGQLQVVAKKCPPVAVAIAKARKDGKSFNNSNSVEFSVVDISDTMGWDSGPVKKELKLLMWNFDAGRPVRTGIMVEFSDLAYHFRTPGDFSTDELDDILQFLHNRVQKQEKSEIHNLSRLYQAMKGIAHRNYWMCSEDVDMARNDKLKVILNEYFDSQKTSEDTLASLPPEPIPEFSEGQLISDIRGFYNLYGQEHTITGRSIARIFHGIASPCFPATTWGRVRRFWRSHLDVDFNTLMKIATRELIAFR